MHNVLRRCGCVVALMACAAILGCSDRLTTVCGGVGYFAVDVPVRDQFGQAQALGARVTLTDGDYTETDVSGGDTLHIYGALERGGRTYDVRVSKRYYNDTVVHNLNARGGGCVTNQNIASSMSTVPVRLTLAPGAPAIRAVYVLPGASPLLDRGGSLKVGVSFDANPDVPRGVIWSIAGDTTSIAFDRNSRVVTYRCAARSDSVRITASSIVDPTISDAMFIRFQGHPAAPNDPPC